MEGVYVEEIIGTCYGKWLQKTIQIECTNE